MPKVKKKILLISCALFVIVVVAGLIMHNLNFPVKKIDVILITIDALRADHLGCYGYPRQTSRNIDRLAKKGALFSNCYAIGSNTIYSCVGLLTGKYLGVIDEFLKQVLDPKFITLAEYLKSFGYRTVALLSNKRLKMGTGIEQGFDYYRTDWVNKGGAEEITREALRILRAYRGKSLFLCGFITWSPTAVYFTQKIFRYV